MISPAPNIRSCTGRSLCDLVLVLRWRCNGSMPERETVITHSDDIHEMRSSKYGNNTLVIGRWYIGLFGSTLKHITTSVFFQDFYTTYIQHPHNIDSTSMQLEYPAVTSSAQRSNGRNQTWNCGGVISHQSLCLWCEERQFLSKLQNKQDE